MARPSQQEMLLAAASILLTTLVFTPRMELIWVILLCKIMVLFTYRLDWSLVLNFEFLGVFFFFF